MHGAAARAAALLIRTTRVAGPGDFMSAHRRLRACVALGLAVLAPLAAGAGHALQTAILRGAPAAGPIELSVGERRVLVTRPIEQARVFPADSADVTRLGPRTVVLTPRHAGPARLYLTAASGTWTIPLAIEARLFEPPRDDAPAGFAEQAPPPFTLTPAPCPAPEAPLPASSLPPPPVLTAVVRTSTGLAAILDHRPAGVGDQLGAYRVERVEPEHCTLSAGGVRVELGLVRDAPVSP